MGDSSFRLASLTARERQIMALVVEGLSSNAIGDRLSISPRTVDTHRASMMHKVGAGSVAALVRIAMVAAANGGHGDDESVVEHSSGLGSLTSRERQVMDLVVEGHSNGDIGRRLSISPWTVEVHRGRVMRKVGAASVAALVRVSMAAAYSEIRHPASLEERDEISEGAIFREIAL